MRAVKGSLGHSPKVRLRELDGPHLGEEGVSARSGGRVRMWRAVGIALAARPVRVTGLRSVTAKKMLGGYTRQKLPSHPDLRMGVKKRCWLRNVGGRCGECVSTLCLCRMEGKMTVPLCVLAPDLYRELGL